jgi:hypothetical protein
VLVTFGGLLSPFAFLMSLLTIGDLDSPPMMDVEIKPGLSCRVMGWGSIPTDGYTVELFRYWTWFPMVQHKVASAAGDGPSIDPKGPTCESVAAANFGS